MEHDEQEGCDYCGEDLDEQGEQSNPPLCRFCREWNGD